MKRKLFILIIVVSILTGTASIGWAGGNARRPAILTSADRVVELQRIDTGWEGTWYWYVGNTYNATNLTGVTALGLLEAYSDTKESAYLDAAINAAGFIMAHLGAGATGTQHHVRLTAPDVIFLHRLGEVTDNPAYASRATSEWANIILTYPTAGELDALFRAINRRSAWDIAFFLEAAYLSGDMDWADDAAAILADTTDTFYYGEDTWWYALNVAGTVRALVACGYASQYYGSVVWLLDQLIGLSDGDNGVGGWAQDTAYAVLAFSTVGGGGAAVRERSGSLACQPAAGQRWLARSWRRVSRDRWRGIESVGLDHRDGCHTRWF